MTDRYVYPQSSSSSYAFRDLGLVPPWEKVYRGGRDVTDEDPSTWPWPWNPNG